MVFSIRSWGSKPVSADTLYHTTKVKGQPHTTNKQCQVGLGNSVRYIREPIQTARQRMARKGGRKTVAEAVCSAYPWRQASVVLSISNKEDRMQDFNFPRLSIGRSWPLLSLDTWSYYYSRQIIADFAGGGRWSRILKHLSALAGIWNSDFWFKSSARWLIGYGASQVEMAK